MQQNNTKHPSLHFRESKVVQSRYYSLTGVCLLILSATILISFVVDLVDLTNAKSFYDQVITDSDYFSIKERRETLKYVSLLYFVRYRVYVVIAQIASLLITWLNACLLDMYLVSGPLSFFSFCFIVSVYHFNTSLVREYQAANDSVIGTDQFSSQMENAAIIATQTYHSLLFNSVVASLTMLLNISLQIQREAFGM